jgi:hypothetical protein
MTVHPGREWPIIWEHIDPECVPLIKALNELVGIHTQECCCGHVEGPLWICLEANRQEDLLPLLLAIGRPEHRANWRIHVETGPPRLRNIYYRLYGPAGHYEQARLLADCLKEGVL